MAPVVPLLQLRGLPPALDTGVSWGAPPTPVQQRTMIWRSCRAQFKTRTFLNAARDLRAASESGSERRSLRSLALRHLENATPLGGLVTSGASLGTCSGRGRRVMKSTASEPTTEPPRMAYQHSRHESSGCKRRPRGPPGNAGCEFCQTGSRERRLFQSG